MPRLVLPLLLALVGAALFGHGAYIHAKALLAQVLLERAFDETIATGRTTKPWSWADTWPVARIEIGRLHARAIVLAGSSGQALAFGPGHVELTPDIAIPISASCAMLRSAMRSTSREATASDFATGRIPRRSCGLTLRGSIRRRTDMNWCCRPAGRSMR
jgi:hypothetical protein